MTNKKEQNKFLRTFSREGAILTGHFRLSSGLHSGQYIQCARVLRKPRLAAKLAKALWKLFPPLKVDAVAAPAVGGITLGYELARVIGAEAIFAEREQDKMTFRRGFEVIRNGNYIVAEDVLTTGQSTDGVMNAIKQEGGKVVGVAALIQRGSLRYDWNVPVRALVHLTIPNYSEADCPLCRERVPITVPGSGHLKQSKV